MKADFVWYGIVGAVVCLGTFTGGRELCAAALPVAASQPGMSGLLLKSSATPQRRTFWVQGQRNECLAIAQVQPNISARSCKLSVSVELRSNDVRPIGSSSRQLKGRHVTTAYASITVCLSGSTMSGRGDCNRAVQNCGIPDLRYPPVCYPAWNARVSTQFQHDGNRAHRIWLDPSPRAGLGFTVHTSHAFSLPRTHTGPGPLPIGADEMVAGTVPFTRGVHAVHVLRMKAFPSGDVRFSVS